ncbi:MAG: ATP-binding cassette domain-containing protein [Candidatus Saccharimonadales bacterium]
MTDILKIVKYSWSLKRYYLWSAFLVVLVSLLNQATPFLLKFVVDGIVRSGHGESVPANYFWTILALILTVGILTTVLANIQGYFGDRLGAKLNSLLSRRYYAHILKLPLEYYDNEIAGKITSRLERSIVTISNLMNAFANNFIGFFLTAAITLVVLAYYALPVAILLGLLFPFYIWLTSLSSKSWQARQKLINADTDVNNGRFVESISQIRAVKSFVTESIELNFFTYNRSRIEDRTREQSIGWHWYDVARRIGLNVIFFGIYAYIVIQTVHGKYTLGELTLLLQLVTQAQFPLYASSFIVDSVQRASAGSKDFFEVMAIEPAVQDTPDATELKVTSGRIEYSGVDFAYTTGEQVLHGVSFTIEPGTKLALVGESGEGKTTLSNLLLRLYDLRSGQIFIDGTDISTATQNSLRENIAVVFQEPALFSGTVHENIAYGQPHATLAGVTAAAKAANAHTFIQKLPDGYETQIGERGVKLSGGQKQRLAIARAILKDAPILVLDEATSSLDSRAEHEVHQALEVLMKGRTTLIIAHRLSTIASVDRIVGIKNGRVAQIGTPKELARTDGIYRDLLKLQNPDDAGKYDIKL